MGNIMPFEQSYTSRYYDALYEIVSRYSAEDSEFEASTPEGVTIGDPAENMEILDLTLSVLSRRTPLAEINFTMGRYQYLRIAMNKTTVQRERDLTRPYLRPLDEEDEQTPHDDLRQSLRTRADEISGSIPDEVSGFFEEFRNGIDTLAVTKLYRWLGYIDGCIDYHK